MSLVFESRAGCSRRVRGTRPFATAAALWLVAGCDDPTAPRTVPASAAPRATVAAGAEGSEWFDPNDSYAQTEMTVDQVYEVVVDVAGSGPSASATQPTLALRAPRKRVRIEMGYDVRGIPRYALTELDPPGDPTTTPVDLVRKTVGGPDGLIFFTADGRRLGVDPTLPFARFPQPGRADGARATLVGMQLRGRSHDASATLGRAGPAGGTPASLWLTRSTDVLAGISLREAAAIGAVNAASGSQATERLVASSPREAVVRTETTAHSGETVTRTFRRGVDGIARLEHLVVNDAGTRRRGLRTTTEIHFGSWQVHSVPVRDELRAQQRRLELDHVLPVDDAVGVDQCDPRDPYVSRSPAGGAAPAGRMSSVPVATPSKIDPCSLPDDPLPPNPQPDPSPPYVPPADPPNGGTGELDAPGAYVTPGAVASGYFTDRLCWAGGCMPPGSIWPWQPCPTVRGLQPAGGLCPPPPGRPQPMAPTYSGAARGIIFQHGILSNRHTWDWMRSWMYEDFPSVTQRAYSLNSLASENDQVTQLENAMARDGLPGSRGDYVYIGHSQGGLVSRALLQRFQLTYRPAMTPIRGTITIGTPHRGAPVAENLSALSSTLRSMLATFERGACTGWTPQACTIDFFLGSFVEGPLTSLANAPAMKDLRPGSGFLVRLNFPGEIFPHVGIRSNSDQRWVEWRVAAEHNSTCAPLSDSCSGQAWVNRAATGYAALSWCTAVFMYTSPIDIGAPCREAANTMDAIDRTWHSMINAPGDLTSDGIVPGGSQVHPYAFSERIYVLDSGPSHVGQTASDRVYASTQRALVQTFGFTLRR